MVDLLTLLCDFSGKYSAMGEQDPGEPPASVVFTGWLSIAPVVGDAERGRPRGAGAGIKSVISAHSASVRLLA